MRIFVLSIRIGTPGGLVPEFVLQVFAFLTLKGEPLINLRAYFDFYDKISVLIFNHKTEFVVNVFGDFLYTVNPDKRVPVGFF